jgi:hypothetical protein
MFSGKKLKKLLSEAYRLCDFLLVVEKIQQKYNTANSLVRFKENLFLPQNTLA